MKFVEIRTLRQRGPIEQLLDTALDRIVMKGEAYIAQWEEGETQYGSDVASIFPTVDRGERGFLVTKDWCASGNYCAEGTEDSLLTLEEGACLILERGGWEHLWDE